LASIFHEALKRGAEAASLEFLAVRYPGRSRQSTLPVIAHVRPLSALDDKQSPFIFADQYLQGLDGKPAANPPELEAIPLQFGAKFSGVRLHEGDTTRFARYPALAKRGAGEGPGCIFGLLFRKKRS
jgi:hypothetical protein